MELVQVLGYRATGGDRGCVRTKILPAKDDDEAFRLAVEVFGGEPIKKIWHTADGKERVLFQGAE